ncbi:MAG: regulatory signaling modulator protein AmpE [Ferrovum sp.]|nr:regulatory signaling modulator protein AmpE [Ferrovum sp.]NDU86833.1 regulatory signaling modulator protein AmpE [Ferrovum sp.]
MKWIVLIVVLVVQSWRPVLWQASLWRQYAHWLEVWARRLNMNTSDPGRWGLGVVVPLLMLWLIQKGSTYLGLEYIVEGMVLWFCLDFHQAVNGLTMRHEQGVGSSAGESQGLREAIEVALNHAYRWFFAPLWWFFVLPGASGALLYLCAWKVAQWLSSEDKEEGMAWRFVGLLDWIPLRLTALSFAVVGDFEEALFVWRGLVPRHSSHLLIAVAGGALGITLGSHTDSDEDEEVLMDEADLLSTEGLLWRTLVLWVVVFGLLTTATWLR